MVERSRDISPLFSQDSHRRTGYDSKFGENVKLVCFSLIESRSMFFLLFFFVSILKGVILSMEDDDDALGFMNWGYYDQPLNFRHNNSSNNLGFQLMTNLPTVREDTKNLLTNPSFLHLNNSGIPNPDSSTPSENVIDSWIHQEEKISHPFPFIHPTYTPISDTRLIHYPHLPDPSSTIDKPKPSPSLLPGRRRGFKSSNSKKPKKKPHLEGEESGNNNGRCGRRKKNTEVVINGIDLDIGGIPTPVCTCTGTPQPCYRWGAGGWQSACCTNNLSTYPLPMNSKRRGARIAGRKMSQGAFKKVLEKLTTEGCDLSTVQIDLKSYWAKHGTNKFVTIR